MERNQAGFSPLEGLLVIGLVIIIGLAGWLVYNRQHSFSNSESSTQQATPSTPASKEQVKAAADAFLIAQLGQDRFEKYYSFDQGRTNYSDPKDSAYDFVAYHFSPLKAVTGNDDVIIVQINRNNLHEIFADSVPNCNRNKSLCDFNVNENRALEIARNNGLTASDMTVSWHTKNDLYARKKALPFVIVVSSCAQNKSVYIDYRNSDVLGTANNCDRLD